MDDDADSAQPLRVLAMCTLLLYVKFLATTMIQGRKGFKAGTRLPEDQTLPMAKGMPTLHAFDAQLTLGGGGDVARQRAMEDELRWKRIIQNDLESLPLAIAVFATSILAGGNARVDCAAMLVYTFARVIHTMAYAAGRALPRMLSWMVAILCVLTAGSSGIFHACTQISV